MLRSRLFITIEQIIRGAPSIATSINHTGWDGYVKNPYSRVIWQLRGRAQVQE